MFKNKSVADDLASLMQEQLVKNASEESHGFEKIAKAVDYLNSAADLFDDVGLEAEAEEITRLLESLAAKKSSKKSKDSKKNSKEDSKESKKDSKKDSKDEKKSKESKKTMKKASDPYTDGLTSEQMVRNLELNGTVFDYAADDQCMDCNDSGDTNYAADEPIEVDFEDEEV